MNLDNQTKHKGSVTFNLPEEKEQSPASPGIHTIHLCAQAVPDTMLVALFDREKEMKELVKHNKGFFKSIESFLKEEWEVLEKTLYIPRTQMSDIEWMARISNALTSPFLEKFKELVGYLGEEENVRLIKIRCKLNRLSSDNYPQFFINCKKEMNEEEYREFVDLLFDKNNIMKNELWEKKVRQQLKLWPNILKQLEEIVSYEIEE